MSEDGPRPRNVKFVDVTAKEKTRAPPAWLSGREEQDPLDPAEHRVSPLSPPEVPSHPRPALAPLLESVRPPPRPPSQFPRPPSQFPGPNSRLPPAGVSASPSQPPAPGPLSMMPGSSTPSQFPGGGGPNLPSQFPGMGEASPEAFGAGRERRRDTLVEDLVPRAEEEAVMGIAAALERFAEERAQALEQAEKELVELVRVICRRVVLREVSLSSAVVEALVQEGLSALGSADRVTVKLGPFFTDVLEHISDNLHHRGIQCSVLIDHDIGTHGCLIETELGRVDESVETRLGVLLASLDAGS
jgi:hypothetical protein